MRVLLPNIVCAFSLTVAVLDAADPDAAQLDIAKTLAEAAKHQDDFELRERLATQCTKFPETFSSIILTEADPTKRWMAVYAIRMSAQNKCDKALVAVFNNHKEAQDLRMQIVMCLGESPELAKDGLLPFLPGLHLLLKERPRRSDLERVIELAGFLGDRSSVSLLTPLLDDKEVHSYTVEKDGKKIPNTISKTAHEALQNITGKRDIPADRSAWEAIK